MKIGILGGTFNPLHKGHIKAAHLAKKRANLDEVWIIPTYKTPAKKFSVEQVGARTRLKMAMASINKEDSSWLKVKDFENKLKGTSFTINTIGYINVKYPEYKLYFIMGSDRYESFSSWYEYKNLRKSLAGVIVLNREKKILKPQSVNDIIINNDVLDISSTMILTAAAWENLPKGTINFISKHKLYIKSLAFYMLKEKRFQHSVSVASHAKRLASKHFYLKPKLAYKAGLAHDIFKLLDIKEQKDIVKKLKPEWTIPNDPAVHGYVAAAWFEKIYGIKNKKFLNSLLNHTTANDNMTKLDKIIYVADKISSDRKGDKIGKLRKLAYSNLDETFIKILKQQINKLKNKNIEIKGNTLKAYKKYVLPEKKNNGIKKI